MTAMPLSPIPQPPLAEPRVSVLLLLGIILSALLVGCGLVFRTYMIAMPTPGMEMARQFGLPFIVAELAVIVWALRGGMDFAVIWRTLPTYAQWLWGSFLAIFWIGSAFVSEVKILAILHNLFLLVHIAFACAVAHLVGRFEQNDLEKMAKMLVIGLFIFCAITAYAFVYHPPFHTMPNNKIEWQFAIPGFISLRLFGAVCGAMFCFLLGTHFLAAEQKRLTYWHWFWITLSAGMMIWSGTRAAVLGSFAVLMLVLLFYRVRPSWRVSLGILLSLAIATCLAIMLVPYGDPTFLLYAPGDGASTGTASGGRFEYWASVWQTYLTVPVFGAGPFSVSYMIDVEPPRHVQPHNILLQFLMSWGGPATALALTMMAIVTLKAHIIATQHRIVLPFLMMLDCLLVMSLLDGMTHFAQHLMLIMIGYGAIFGYQRAVSKGDPQMRVA
jgi:exopolysaccharide production protein ExoQ